MKHSSDNDHLLLFVVCVTFAMLMNDNAVPCDLQAGRNLISSAVARICSLLIKKDLVLSFALAAYCKGVFARTTLCKYK